MNLRAAPQLDHPPKTEVALIDEGLRNPGTALAPAMWAGHQVNLSAAQRRVASLPARRSLKKQWQAAWLVNAMRCMDLTSLAGDDTGGRIARLCARARRPLPPAILEGLGLSRLFVGAVCVYPAMVGHAVHALDGTGIPVASVAAGFPAGLVPLPQRLAEIRHAVEEGAREIDIVIRREYVFTQEWTRLYDEIAQMRAACGPALLKTILATGDLKSLRSVYAAAMVAMQAGSDFVKTSTGKEPVNATLCVGLVMARAIRDYFSATGHRVGFKPAGGLRFARDALGWQILMKEELGPDWLRPGLFRLGASGLAGDIERQLAHFLDGRYADSTRQAPG